jgi:hypothetical protein
MVARESGLGTATLAQIPKNIIMLLKIKLRILFCENEYGTTFPLSNFWCNRKPELKLNLVISMFKLLQKQSVEENAQSFINILTFFHLFLINMTTF